MDKLEAYNQILGEIGEYPINSLDAAGIGSALINAHFEVTKRNILGMCFSFNTDTQTLSPNNDDVILVASPILYVRFPAGMDNLTTRGSPTKVWDNIEGEYWSSPVIVLATKDVDFDQIPELFQQWIWREVAIVVRRRMNSVDQHMAYLKQEANFAKAVALNSEPANSYNITGWGNIQSAHNA